MEEGDNVNTMHDKWQLNYKGMKESHQATTYSTQKRNQRLYKTENQTKDKTRWTGHEDNHLKLLVYVGQPIRCKLQHQNNGKKIMNLQIRLAQKPAKTI